ncbi:MAG: rod shape-determining protein RodA [Gammaproteobacteria bacterium]|nr:rod shape-determining protein RodA [Gammaproteobacteria bacterium]
MSEPHFVRSLPQHSGLVARPGLRRLQSDPILWVLLVTLILYGLVMLYSAVERDMDIVGGQVARLCLALVLMGMAAQVHPARYLRWAPGLYAAGVLLLVAVLLAGVTVKGSQRWLELPGIGRFQPSELMKIALPLMIAWYFHDRPLPPTFKDLFRVAALIGLPVGLIILEPDLGTGILALAGGLTVVFLAGLPWRWIVYGSLAGVAMAPALWFALQPYQQQRILTLFDPDKDPLGAGWNIIQSTTALGSGGLFGKGLHDGTQSQLKFLPESHTDFIVAVIGEELGFTGVAALLILYLLIVARGLVIAAQSKHTFGRLAASSLTMVFFVYLFANIAMVAGLLPVVGLPLPLVSYGGTSAITLLLGFGIIMSIHGHRS